ncbi:hypothetical protein OSB04_001434 [Centaurea solstitialis]|uniref:Uncharacterized protein n=1 Tax=Centaurea solstitialis TaxID=347529 RepID=A0AA38TQZ3_9ASTR|nr:hypothetical protein OSB04_001434 [Centaurea solstitialis]
MICYVWLYLVPWPLIQAHGFELGEGTSSAVVGFKPRYMPRNTFHKSQQWSTQKKNQASLLDELENDLCCIFRHVSCWFWQTLEMLEKKEKVLLKKASAEVEKAKDYTRAKNKRAAIQCLKRKKLYEQQIEQLGNFQLRVHDQMIMLEGAKATTETVDALRTGAAAMKAMQKATNIDDVDKTMDEINEQTENMKQIQEALATPIGAAADFDEFAVNKCYELQNEATLHKCILIIQDELEAELEELEGAELEEQLLQPATTAPAAPVQAPAGRQPTRPAPRQNTAEEDELAALQAEMAL